MVDPVLAIFLKKELRDLRGNSQVLPGYLLLPLIVIAIPTIMLAVLPLDPTKVATDPDIVALFRIAQRDPSLTAYPEVQRLSRIIVREVGAFFLLIPIILCAMSAALTIAAEKQQRTLEPILATPLSDQDLLIAKLVGALAPAVVVTWVTALVYCLAIGIVTLVRFGEVFWPSGGLLLGIAVLAPLGGAAAALVGMRASIRAVDVQGAVQTASLWVLPLGIGLVGLLGRMAIRSAPAGLIGSGLMALVVWWLFRGNLRRFQREEILTRWT